MQKELTGRIQVYMIYLIWISLILLTSCSRKIEYNYWYGIYIPPKIEEDENRRRTPTSQRPRGKFNTE